MNQDLPYTEINFILNGINRKEKVNPNDRLLDFLRKDGLISVKSGCGGQGDCGMCTVLINNKPVQSCLV